MKKNITEKELKAIANVKAETIVIRTYENGNSNDEKRQSTSIEKAIISSLIYGSLLSIQHGSDIQSVKNTAEYIAIILLPEMNGYDTIYNRIQDAINELL